MRIRRWIALLTVLTLLLGVPVPATLAIAEETPASEGECAATGGSHSFGAWEVTSAATCTEKGVETRVCSACGATETRSTPKVSHKYGSWRITRQATCTQEGKRVRTCSVCKRDDTQTIEKLPHTWGEWTVLTEPTDHSPGERTHTCEVCGETQSETFLLEGTLRRGDNGDDVRTLQEGLICYGALTSSADGSFGPATERAVIQVQTDAGLPADGIAWPQTQKLLEHPYGAWEVISELSDFSAGIRQRVCERCGHVEREEEWPSPLYRRGDSGDDVRALQNALNEAGYNCGYADGSFGGRTESAISALEEANGIEPDGIAWPGVLKLLGLPLNDEDSEASSLLLNVVPSVKTESVHAGDTVRFTVRLTNDSDKELLEPAIQSFVGETPARQAQRGEALPAGETWEIEDEYTYTEDDALAGTVLLSWQAVAVDETEAQYTSEDTLEYHVMALEDGSVKAEMIPTNLPDRGYYIEGETVRCEITIYNNADAEIYNLEIHEAQATDEAKQLPALDVLASGKSIQASVYYTVNEADAASGEVVNAVNVTYTDGDGLPHALSAAVPIPVESPVGENETPESEPETETENADYCRRTLLQANDSHRNYALDYCAAHSAVASAANALMDLQDWEAVIVLWTEALNADYDALMQNASEQEKPVILNDKALFYVQLAALRNALSALYPDDSEMSARVAANQLMNRAADLCMMAHTAPENRADSIADAPEDGEASNAASFCRLNAEATDSGLRLEEHLCEEHRMVDAATFRALESADEDPAEAWQNISSLWAMEFDVMTQYLDQATDKAGKAALSASRTAFDDYLSAEESLLEWLYPDSPETVSEVMSQTIRGRVLALCDSAE